MNLEPPGRAGGLCFRRNTLKTVLPFSRVLRQCIPLTGHRPDIAESTHVAGVVESVHSN